jgi:hypothetical protein
LRLERKADKRWGDAMRAEGADEVGGVDELKLVHPQNGEDLVLQQPVSFALKAERWTQLKRELTGSF